MDHPKNSKYNGANAGDALLHRPLLPKKVEEFRAARTDMDSLRHGIVNLCLVQNVRKLRIKQVRFPLFHSRLK
jgi:hypothetical protein